LGSALTKRPFVFLTSGMVTVNARRSNVAW
jgi:hypothetical protein